MHARRDPASLDALLAFPSETDGGQRATRLTLLRRPSDIARSVPTIDGNLRGLVKDVDAPTIIATATLTRLLTVCSITLTLLVGLVVLGVLARTYLSFSAMLAGL